VNQPELEQDHRGERQQDHLSRGCQLDLSQVRGIWVFLNSGGVDYIDNIRAG
jgi:hypothetical protein